MGSLSSFHMAYFCSSNRWPDAHVTTVAPPGQKQESGVRACQELTDWPTNYSSTTAAFIGHDLDSVRCELYIADKSWFLGS